LTSSHSSVKKSQENSRNYYPFFDRELSRFVKDIYSILETGDPTQPLYTVPKSSFLPNALSPTPTTKDPIVTVDIGGTNLRITWKHGEDLREFKEPVEDFFYPFIYTRSRY
jgi:hexokinase